MVKFQQMQATTERQVTFESQLEVLCEKKLKGQKYGTVRFVAVSPPLIPKTAFDKVAKKRGYYNFPQQVACIYALQ